MKIPPFTKENWLISLFLAGSVGVISGHFVSQLMLDGPSTPVKKTPLQSETARNDSSTPEIEGPAVSWEISGNQATTLLIYDTPVGEENNPLSLTIENGKITDYQLDITTSNSTSQRYQQEFIEQLEQIIAGSSVEQLQNIDTLGGATVTTDAFRNAVQQLPS